MNRSLRALQKQDLALIREWRNHPAVMQFMFSQHEIGEQEHADWFAKVSKDKRRHLLLYLENDEPVGFMQLHERESAPKLFEWGFYIAPNAAKGTGTRLCSCALEYAFSELQALKIYGEALEFNQASIALHQKLGFVQEGRLRKQHQIQQRYHDIFCFGLLKSEYLQHNNQ